MTDPITTESGKPLTEVPGWSPDQVARMARIGVSTAEQVVAVAATSGGARALAEQLGVPEAEAQHLVAAARTALPPGTVKALEQPVDTFEYGLGVPLHGPE
jgi:hypothetical protein